MMTAFLVGFALPVVLFLLGLGFIALHKSRQEAAVQQARHYHLRKRG